MSNEDDMWEVLPQKPDGCKSRPLQELTFLPSSDAFLEYFWESWLLKEIEIASHRKGVKINSPPADKSQHLTSLIQSS